MQDGPAGAGDREVRGPCPNCGDPAPGNYCPTCGQRRIERRVTLRRMLAEVVEDQLSLNAALPRTLSALLLHPGLLSREYVAGRIQRYVPPFRLYLVSSLLFFLVLSLVTHADTDRFIAAPGESDSAAVRIDMRDVTLRGDATPGDAPGARDSARAAEIQREFQELEVRTGMAVLDSVANRRLRELQQLGLSAALRVVFGELVRRAPTAMFLLLPLFALLLKLLYVGRGRYYVEHFVFGLHTHAFAYLLLTVVMVLSSWIELGLMLWLWVYFYLAMKRFYGQGWLTTLARYVVLAWAYSVFFFLVLGGTLIVALLLG